MKRSTDSVHNVYAENTVARPIAENLQINNLRDSYQSPYSRNRSTETTLLSVLSSIAETLIKGSMAAIILLGLSSCNGPRGARNALRVYLWH